jgi:hypothetical protein
MRSPQALDQLIDAARGDPAHVGLLHDRHQRLLAAFPWLQKAREVAALPQLGDLQLDLARARVPAPCPIPVALRGAITGPALTELSADQLRHLGLHDLARDRLHRRADHVPVLIAQHLPDDLLDRHPLLTGHRPASFRRSVRPPTIMSAAVAGTAFSAIPSEPQLHQP